MRLLDCFTELITYTGYLIKNTQENPFSYEDVAKNYDVLVSRAQECGKACGFDEAEWQDGFFPVCAWVDESILCSNWEWKEKWAVSQLQKQYFNTTAAGDEFYNRLENLDDEARTIREVYEFCLALGFKGRYYQASDKGRLEDIRYTNLKHITENTDFLFPEELFPDAYESALASKKRKRKKWRGVSGFSILVIILPIILFGSLFFLFETLLSKKVAAYFGTGHTSMGLPNYFRGRIPRPVAAKTTPTPVPENVHQEASIEKRRKEIEKKAGTETEGQAGIKKDHYVVKKGDTLSSIAAREDIYGGPLNWTVLYRLNAHALGGEVAGRDLPEKALDPGMRLKILTREEIQENLKKRSAHRWVVNVLSSRDYERIIPVAMELSRMGYSAYITRAEVKGKEWLRLRVGFLNTMAEAQKEGKKIGFVLRVRNLWPVKIGKKEFENHAGY